MKCLRCQHENPADAVFCQECGTRLEAACPGCGTANKLGAKFCKKCGQPAATAPPAAAVKFPSPESYTPKHLAEKILTSKAALEGERKQVTVLFADLKGSMELLADRDPEEARKLLDPVLERMMEAVHRYEGTVNQVMGDGIMALFGAPLAHEDHAVRACYAALRMQESVGHYAQGVFQTYGVPIQIRVGLNSGSVVVRAIGSDLHMDYTAVGQTTHLAARMEQLALPGTILLTADTLRLVEGGVEVAARGPTAVKGMSVPVNVYELLRARALRTRIETEISGRGLSRFVGRDAETESLQRCLLAAARGRGQLVAVVGDPGAGKSRLLYELLHSDATLGWRVFETRAVPHGSNVMYSPIIDLFKRYFDVHDGDRKTVVQRVHSAVGQLESLAASHVSALVALFDIDEPDSQWAALDPPQRRRRTLDACTAVLLAEAGRQPIVLVVEDLHWIDGGTQAWLDVMVNALPAARVVVLVSYRPEYRHAWGSKTYYAQVRVEPLAPELAYSLLDALLGIAEGLVPLKRLLVERTEGNPLFLEEMVRDLVETGRLLGEPGARRLAGPLVDIRVPATVEVVLASRIDRLATEDKQTLQAASAIGKEGSLKVLAGIVNLSSQQLAAVLKRLRSADLIYESGSMVERQYTFKHALTHDVAYGSLLLDQRKALHRVIVEAMEQLFAERLAEHVEWLAYHAARAEDWRKAATYSYEAGMKVQERSAALEATEYFEGSLAALTRLPASDEVVRLGIDVRLALRRSAFLHGDLTRVERHLNDAQSLARNIGDRTRQARATAQLCTLRWYRGELRRAAEEALAARALADECNDLDAVIHCNVQLVYSHHCCGDYRRAEDYCAEVLALIAPERRAEFRLSSMGWPPAIPAFAFLAASKAERGAFDEGASDGAAGVHLAETFAQPFARGMAAWGMGFFHRLRGELAVAEELLTRAFELAKEWQVEWWLAHIGSLLGHVKALRGDREGVEIVREALARFEARGFGPFRSLAMVNLGEAQLAVGELDEAGTMGRRGLARANEQGERGHGAWALKLLGDVAERCGEEREAQGRYDACRSAAEELGMRPLVAHCHLGLGKLYRRTRKREQAQEHLTIATTMYREMGMTYWLEKAEAMD
jgi:class 3 adenylate cyclase/tetratricopeptide (TPR) repeat protein